MEDQRKGFVTLKATPEFIGRLRTWCRDEHRQLGGGILFLIEEGLDARKVQADPALVDAERRAPTQTD